MDSINLSATNSISMQGKQKTSPMTAEQKRQTRLGIAIAATTAGVGLTTLVLGKGLNKSNRGVVNKLYTYLTKKSGELAKKPAFTKSEKLLKSAVNTGKSVAESTRAVMNTISFKDILFKKATSPIPGIGKACQAITNFFENVAIKTTANSYEKTTKNFNKMYDAFEVANSKVSQSTAKTAGNTIKKVQQVFDKNFTVGESLTRIDKTKKGFNNFDEKFWNNSFKQFKNLAKNKNTYSSFIAEKMLAGNKTKILSEVNANKAAIQYSYKDEFKALKELADGIKGMTNPFDKNTMSIFDNIQKNLDVFNKNHSATAKETLINDLKTLTTFIEDKKAAEQFNKSLDTLPKSKLGRLQSLLKIYEKELSEKDYKKLEKQVNKAMKSLEKSTTLETDKLFDKMRDLKIGSAPTDMLTLLTTFTTVGIGLAKADDSDSRKSAALKFGIPAIGTVLTTMYGTLKMFSAGQSLIFGAITGLVINKIGEAADNLRLRTKGQKDANSNLVEMPTQKEISDAIISNTIILSDAKKLHDGTELVINTINENVDLNAIKKPEFLNLQRKQ
ncbi:hypothetical protein IJ732_08445 [bacterium]|nr:hypothetical protein [bacterium]